MPRTAQGPFQSSREGRREMLVEHFVSVIEPLLAQSTFNEISVEQIIKEGRIGRTTFYSYFNDKSDLLLAMGQQVVGDLRAIAFWRLPHDATYEDLRGALRSLVDVYSEHRVLLRALVEGSGYDVALRTVYRAAVARGVEGVESHIASGQQDGSIAGELAPRGTALLLVHMAASALHEVIGNDDESDRDEFLESLTMVIWRILYAGVRPEPRNPTPPASAKPGEGHRRG